MESMRAMSPRLPIDLPRADLTFLLDAPLEDLYERKAGDLVPYECGMDPACSRESFITHQTKISRCSRSLGNRFSAGPASMWLVRSITLFVI